MTALATVTVIGVDSAVLPVVSVARAVRVWVPLVAVVVFQDVLYGVVVSGAASAVLSSRNCTPATPTLSVAVAVRVRVPDTVPPVGAVSTAAGGVVSPPVAAAGLKVAVWRIQGAVPPRGAVVV